MTYASEVTADSPKLWARFTTNFADSGSLGSAVTAAAGVTAANANGIPGEASTKGAAVTRATTGYVDWTAVLANTTNSGTFTMEIWIKTADQGSGIIMGSLSTPYYYMGLNANGTVYATANAATLTSPGVIDDDAWHHIVAVFTSGGTHRLYVDGTQVATTTGTSTGPAGTHTFRLGNNQSAFGFNGYVDELALYPSALSAGRVKIHYDNGRAITNGGYTATPATASATVVDATGQGNVRKVAPTDDSYTSAGQASTNYGNANEVWAGTSYGAYLRATPPDVEDGEVAVPVSLTIYPDSNFFSGTLSIYRVTEAWDEDTITDSNRPNIVFVKTISPSVSGFNPLLIDVSDVLTEDDYGVALIASSTREFVSKDSGLTQYHPFFEYVVSPQVDESYPADGLTASALMVDPTVSTTAGVSASGQPFAAAATLVNPTVTVISHIDVDAEPAEASAAMGNSGFAEPFTGLAEPFTAAAAVVDPSITTQRGPRITAAPMTASALWKPPSLVNGEPIVASDSEDKYFQRVKSLNPKIWYRLNDSGSTAVNRTGVAPAIYSGGLVTGMDGLYDRGVFRGQHNAPENRHSVSFDGTGMVIQGEPSGTNVDENTQYDASGIPKTTLDFNFRTSKATQFILAGKDNFQNPVTLTTSVGTPREVVLKDGKITYRTYYAAQPASGRPASVGEFSGFRNLADGEWHSVSIRSNVNRFDELGVEIWVDGKLEVRRVVTGAPASFMGFPDYIGGRPDEIDGWAVNALPGSQWFEGDMSEVVFYDHLNTEHQTTRLYYDFMAWTPIEATAIESFAFTPAGHKGRGNQKRALYLWWDAENDTYSVAGSGGNNQPNTDPVLGAQGNEGIYDYAGYKVFSRSVIGTSAGATPYRDRVTDQRTFIDLEHDVDIDDYDVIMFGDWPDEGDEIDFYDTYAPGMRERLINQIRWANEVKGLGLFVTHPRLAVDLGIVDRVEWVPTLRESAFNPSQGNASGLYDYGSAVKFPWNIITDSGLESTNVVGSIFNGQPMNTDPAFLANKAFYYGDTNKNDRFRVRALIEGLTNIPSYMIQDAIYQKDYSSWGWSMVAYKYLHRMAGLQIGDEYIFHGSDFGGDRDYYSTDFTDLRIGRHRGTWATPLANVKAGTVVTTFGAKLWQGTQQIDNPYKDYATSIVLRRGDVLAGRPVGGRIYVNFSEQPNRAPEAVAVQVLPENDADFPYTYTPDTPAQRQWEWSDTRKSLTSTQSPVSNPIVQFILPDGTVDAVRVGTATNQQLTMTRSVNLFPLAWYPSWQMNNRGLWWLGQEPEFNEGDKAVASEPLTATAAMPSPTVVAQRDASVAAAPATALAQMPKVAEDESGEVDVHTLPMTAEARFTGFGRTVSAAPMVAEATLVENFDSVHASGEQVVLTLHGYDVTLFLKEEV